MRYVMSVHAKDNFLGPYWGSSYSFSQGRDPLGIQRSSIAAYGVLVPGLTNLTKRIRYYGFYCWLIEFYLEKIMANEKDKIKGFKRFVRRSEFFIAIIMQAFDKEILGIPGSLKATQYLKEFESNKNQNYDIKTYGDDTKNGYWRYSSGAFGQYFVGSLKDLGLIDDVDKYIGIYYATKKGKLLGDAFYKNACKKLEPKFIDKVFRNINDIGVIKSQDAKKIFGGFNMSIIPENTKEHKLYSDILLGDDTVLKKKNEYKNFRKDSIDFIKNINKEAISNSEFFRNYHANTFEVSNDSSNSSVGWRYFQINEYTNYAHVTLLWGLLNWLYNFNEKFIHIDDLINQISNELVKDISKIIKMNKTQLFLNNILNSDNIDIDINKTFDEIVTIKRNNKSKYIHAMSLAVVCILAVFKKYRDNFKDIKLICDQYEMRRFGDVFDNFELLLKQTDYQLNDLIKSIQLENVINKHIYTA
ncbi:MAG: hypothetical protein ABSG15_14475, partial [FCB group bacterium]